jgi:hypothetical protein
MCGDLEENDPEGERLHALFVRAAQEAIHEAIAHRGGSRNHLEEAATAPGRAAQALSNASLHGYMDGLYGDILSVCVEDSCRVEGPTCYCVLASQAVVLARAAGFVAGCLDRDSNPLRIALDSLIAGYRAQR